MKVMTEEQDVIKLCHANPGDVVQLVDGNMLSEGSTYLVCVVPDKDKRSARPGMTHGLYDEERSLFLVNISTGERRDMAHLSSRAVIFDRAEVHLGREARK
ncbi:hypothetical protein [Burkholderia sp. Ac-20349]|uniref:hypothetical protein n=1 Tax=Burkholderia sp. Ac-20349 TaxID=2703893 RepID=UPI00197BEFF6|nr:hypothetical protein [Burkholderia sp. Ac-20349]MBN3839334.1 hypothetical protein [Burkholderia sp. Ac-20349]